MFARWLGGVVVAPFSRVVKISVHINYGRHCGNVVEAGAEGAVRFPRLRLFRARRAPFKGSPA